MLGPSRVPSRSNRGKQEVSHRGQLPLTLEHPKEITVTQLAPDPTTPGSRSIALLHIEPL